MEEAVSDNQLVPQPLQATDEDRAQTERLLEDAFAHGRIDHDELLARTSRIWNARNRADLDLLLSGVGIADAGTVAELPRRMPVQHNAVTGKSGPPATFAMMGGSERAGHWVCPARHVATAVMGGVTIDLRDAEFESQDTTIVVIALMGGVDVIVPPDMDVQVTGVGIMGGFGRSNASGTVRPAANGPKVKVTGLALMGGGAVTVRTYGEPDD